MTYEDFFLCFPGKKSKFPGKRDPGQFQFHEKSRKSITIKDNNRNVRPNYPRARKKKVHFDIVRDDRRENNEEIKERNRNKKNR